MDQTATMPDTHQTRSTPDASTPDASTLDAGSSDGPASRAPGILARAWRGDPADHPAARPALVLLLVGTAA
ncbi:MAG: hypothetical protein EON53_17135, partial [Actinomycetales bacterium]